MRFSSNSRLGCRVAVPIGWFVRHHLEIESRPSSRLGPTHAFFCSQRLPIVLPAAPTNCLRQLRSRFALRRASKEWLSDSLAGPALANTGEVVTRDEICRDLWPADTFVDFEHSLAAAVNKIREALGESADDPRYIETLPKRGYRFIGKIRPDAPVVIAVAEPQRHQGSAEVQAAVEAIRPDAATAVAAPSARLRLSRVAIGAGAAALILLAVGAAAWLRAKRSALPATSQKSLIQLTDFADSAVSPALSPDGRILTFNRGPGTFMSTGQIYAKLLPDGEPVQLTHDHFVKMGPQVSPDGSTVAYTVFASDKFNTWMVPVLGGEPRLMFPNTEGLTWIDSCHLVFSEFVSGIHMSVVTSTSTRDQLRYVYVPPRERGMVSGSGVYVLQF